MDPIRFWVPGEPKALKRHRSTRSGHQYDPSKQDKADFLAKALACYRPDVAIDDPLFVTMLFVFGRPKCHYRTGRHADKLKDGSPLWHTDTPDLSNCVKLPEDALNGWYWEDDRRIIGTLAYKVYGMAPGVAVHIRSPNDGDYSHVVLGLDEIMGR